MWSPKTFSYEWPLQIVLCVCLSCWLQAVDSEVEVYEFSPLPKPFAELGSRAQVRYRKSTHPGITEGSMNFFDEKDWRDHGCSVYIKAQFH